MSVRESIGLGLALGLLAGCSFHMRSPDQYRTATRSLLDAQRGSIESCYANALTSDAEAGGKVVVKFDVQEKSGDLMNAAVVPEETTADATLQQCVLSALEGLKLDPPDQRLGQATFQWDFNAAKQG